MVWRASPSARLRVSRSATSCCSRVARACTSAVSVRPSISICTASLEAATANCATLASFCPSLGCQCCKLICGRLLLLLVLRDQVGQLPGPLLNTRKIGASTARAVWPLRWMELKQTTPELSYLLAKWGSTLSYRRVAQVLEEFLPPSNGAISPATVRRHTLAVGQRLDMRATEPDEYDCLALQRNRVPSSARLTVAIDGAYIRANGSVATPALRCRRTNRAEWTIGRSVCLGGSGPSQAQGFHEGGSR
jgi:hypothetical protein